MTRKSDIEDFLSQRTLGLVGVSRNNGKFGNAILKELSGKGYKIYPIHPHPDAFTEIKCSPSIEALPEPVGGLIISVSPAQTEIVAREAMEAEIPRIWMQQGAESESAIRFCEERGIRVIHRECILMYAEPTPFIHRLHRWIRGLFGRLPK